MAEESLLYERPRSDISLSLAANDLQVAEAQPAQPQPAQCHPGT